MAKNNVEDVVIIGLVSSHPYAVMALSNASNRVPINLKFIANHAKDVIRACNIPYLSYTQVTGLIFDEKPHPAVDINQTPVSLVKTDFFVDHNEVRIILKDIREKWILGSLLDSHEFLVVLPATSVRRSKTRSSES